MSTSEELFRIKKFLVFENLVWFKICQHKKSVGDKGSLFNF